MLHYKRILLKLSGEALAGEDGYGINPEMLERYAEEIKEASEMGAQIAIVIGGGNIFRGMSEAAEKMDRVQADYMGMLATVINALAFQDALERKGVSERLRGRGHAWRGRGSPGAGQARDGPAYQPGIWGRNGDLFADRA